MGPCAGSVPAGELSERGPQIRAGTVQMGVHGERATKHVGGLTMLAEREVRVEARKALLAIGAPALAFLKAALDDANTPLAVRRHVPRSISQFSPELAAPLLLERLLSEHDGSVRFKILRGLGRLRDFAG